MLFPYARQEYDLNSPSGFSKVCPACGEWIPVIERKDFESFTGIEYYNHYKELHKEKD